MEGVEEPEGEGSLTMWEGSSKGLVTSTLLEEAMGAVGAVE